MIKWISLYLSGLYPGHYIQPDKLKIIFKIRILDSSNFTDSIINQLSGLSNQDYFNSLLENFKDIHGDEEFNKLLDFLCVPLDIRQNAPSIGCNDQQLILIKTSEKDNKILVLSGKLHNSISDLFAKGIKSQLYNGAFIEAFKVLNDKLKLFCVDNGKGERNEADAINCIFDEMASKNAFGFARGTDSGDSQEEGLKNLFLGLVKYWRNPAAHEKGFINNEEDFIESMILLSLLLKNTDKLKISKKTKKN